MKPLTYMLIYCGAFFVITWACGYSPVAIGRFSSLFIYDPGLNGFEPYRFPSQIGISPALFLAFVYGLGFLCAYFLSAKRAAFDFVVLRKNIFIGLICVGSIFAVFQPRGQWDFLKKNIRFDFQKFTIHEKIPQALNFAVNQANLVKEKYQNQSLSLKLDMGKDCNRDPCFYVKRTLEYYLYPIDVASIRGQKIDGVLYMENGVLTIKNY